MIKNFNKKFYKNSFVSEDELDFENVIPYFKI